MKSCIYECRVMHFRVWPKKYKFFNKIFMFYLDLDQLDSIAQEMRFFGRNRKNIFSFYDDDHIKFGSQVIRENIEKYVKEKGIKEKIGKVMLLTNVRVFGYIFNPVSFYYCFDEKGEPLCIVAEICNTFREIKPFFIGRDQWKNGKFKSEQKKYFYISPFIDLDIPMDFQLKVPGERLNIQIDDLKEDRKFLYTTLTGKKFELNNKNLLWFGIKYPFVTLKTIFFIHYHAAKLHFIKKLPYHKKDANKHLQKGLQNEYVKH